MNFISKALTQLQRNWFAVVPAVIVMSIVLVLTNSLVRLREESAGILEALNKRYTITVFLSADADQASIRNLIAILEQRTDVAAPVTYTSPEDALVFLSSTFRFTAEEMSGVGLPASLLIRPTTPDRSEDILAFVRRNGGAILHESTATLPTETAISDQMQRFLTSFEASIARSLSIFTILLVISGVLLIACVILLGIMNRKKEIAIMRLVGAHESSILLPFVGEAVMIALLAFLIQLILSMLLNVLPVSPQLTANLLLLEGIGLIAIAAGTSYAVTRVMHIV